MSIEKLKAVADQITARLPMVKNKGEEATKQALVLPMLDALGFDIWNPAEVCPEYEADFMAEKKQGQKEKVDFAILIENIPRIYIEVKSVDVSLDGHEGQLARYFNATKSVSLAILTNGIEYRFYTDTGDLNIMDSLPFNITKLTELDRGLEIFARFHKAIFSPNAIRDFATQINYTTKISGFLRKQLDLGDNNPSEEFVRWILSEEASYTGRISLKSIERFQPIIKDALQIVLRDIVRRSVAALDKEVRSPTLQGNSSADRKSLQESTDQSIQEDNLVTLTKKQAVVTEDELILFAAIKNFFEQSEFFKQEIFDKSQNKKVRAEISYANNHIYFSVYLNSISNWIIRASVESKTPWIGFNIPSEFGEPLIPQGITKIPSCRQSKFRISYTKDQVIQQSASLLTATIKHVISNANGE
ncbi:type I restriction enzyme HsdR N-terminal domain-containing protein [Rhodoferax sp. 4810]|uniref:Type I restriction enzyme HsdR N-terminal domain-containing protein n=1 Tax=Thiospirillum jenense TaxID=1653858 RepID=A0A839HJK3_9GAMM|nr:type I restriction endonuclease [Thiospirillum jenense]MBB1075110.1 type I restriction enzyme HsdR N-terminal domain-containing protein [Rhodoferax jenense]MBB1126759.1 type I restriction enzyme HsdR N-terminal domain-containing protein [Thiospirillum jenense]